MNGVCHELNTEAKQPPKVVGIAFPGSHLVLGHYGSTVTLRFRPRFPGDDS
jgi:hypothetical protein